MNENTYNREMADLEQSLEDGLITQKQFCQYVRELNEDFAELFEGGEF